MRAIVAFLILPGLVALFILTLVSFSHQEDSILPVTGSAIFESRCVSCHQSDGQGIPGVFPPLNGSGWVNGDEERLVRIVLHGLTGELSVDGILYNGAMPGWGSSLSDSDIASVLDFVRSSWGNESATIAVERVAQVRSKTGQRTKPWTVDELTMDYPG